MFRRASSVDETCIALSQQIWWTTFLVVILIINGVKAELGGEAVMVASSFKICMIPIFLSIYLDERRRFWSVLARGIEWWTIAENFAIFHLFLSSFNVSEMEVVFIILI